MQKTGGRMAARKAAGRAEREAAAGMAAGPGSRAGRGFPADRRDSPDSDHGRVSPG